MFYISIFFNLHQKRGNLKAFTTSQLINESSSKNKRIGITTDMLVKKLRVLVSYILHCTGRIRTMNIHSKIITNFLSARDARGADRAMADMYAVTKIIENEDDIK